MSQVYIVILTDHDSDPYMYVHSKAFMEWAEEYPHFPANETSVNEEVPADILAIVNSRLADEDEPVTTLYTTCGSWWNDRMIMIRNSTAEGNYEAMYFDLKELLDVIRDNGDELAGASFGLVY